MNPAARGTVVEIDDLRLVRALQLAPRAGFARLAAAVGGHERTVARRYRRLRRAGVLRVFGMVNPMAVGHQFWQVRVRCRPDAAESLATALAARDDIAWVAVAAAGAEVSFSIRSLSADRRDLLLTRGLPRTAHVLGIEASVVLHVFEGLTARGWSALADVLTPTEEARLTTAPPQHATPPAPEPHTAPPTPPLPHDATATPPRTPEPRDATPTPPLAPEPYDAALVEVLAVDGRASVARLAEAAGVSPDRVTRRLAALLRTRTVVIDVDVAHAALGHPVGAQLQLTVAPARVREVGTALAALPEVGFAAAVSGPANVTASVACRDLAHLYEVTTAAVGALDGVTALEVVPFARVVKQSGGPVTDGRLVAPAP